MFGLLPTKSYSTASSEQLSAPSSPLLPLISQGCQYVLWRGKQCTSGVLSNFPEANICVHLDKMIWCKCIEVFWLSVLAVLWILYSVVIKAEGILLKRFQRLLLIALIKVSILLRRFDL